MNAMEFVEDGSKVIKPTTKAGKKLAGLTDINNMGTGSIVWFLTKKHKFFISVIVNVVLLANLFGWITLIRALI